MDEHRFYKLLAATTMIVVVMALVARSRHTEIAYDASVCAGPPLKNVAERQQAMMDGYSINARYQCIDKASYNASQQEIAAAKKPQGLPHQQPIIPAQESKQTLAEARRDFHTAIALPLSDNFAAPKPPEKLFVRSDYQSGGLELAAFVTPDPRDASKHPAIIWLTGGNSNALDNFWTPGPESNDQSASAYREAGIVMMFPTLRGGNTNPGKREFMLGEVDDVLAAAKHLARLPYVDPAQIYLGGHSTGGTLALLTSESSGFFHAVFAFGAVASPEAYDFSIFPLNFGAYPSEELKLRSPVYWLDGIVSPTFLLEGTSNPSNIQSLEQLCKINHNPLVHCLPIEQENHFSVLARMNRLIAARIVMSGFGMGFTLSPEDARISKK